MRTTIALLVLLLAAPVAAEEITVDKVLAAHSFGVAPEALLAKINDPATSVSAMTTADADRLRAAGVPEAVVGALLARAPQAAPVASGHQPDNPRAIDLVKAVRTGTSEALIVDQLMQNGVMQRPSLNDLIYLKENKVPEGIIRALMEAPLVAAPAAGAAGVRSMAAAPVPSQVEVDGLARKTGLFAKSRPGKLVLTAERIEWIDGTSQAESFEMFPAGLKAVETECLARPDGKFCHEVEFQMAKGSDFSFTDARKDVGGNESIKALLSAVKVLYPKLPVVEKVK